MGLADFLMTAAPIAAQAGGAYAQGQANANQLRIQEAVQQIQMQRQLEQMRIDNALKQAQTGEAQQHGALYQREAATPRLGDPGYASAMGDVAGAEAAAKWQTTQKQLDAEHQNRLAEIQAEGGNALAVAQENARAASARQTAEQQFIAEQNNQNRQNTANIAQKNVAGRLQGIKQTQSGEVLPMVESWFNRGPLANPSTTTRATSISPTPPSPHSTARPQLPLDPFSDLYHQQQ